MKLKQLRKMVLLLLVYVLVGSPWPGFCSQKRDVHLNERFLQAAQKGDYEDLQNLLDLGAEVNARGKYGDTALIWAALRGQAKMVQYLLAKGAEVNAKNDVKETPLILATDNKNVAVVRLLLAHGADINSKRYDGATPLMIASRYADVEMVKLLLAAGANPKEKDNAGQTALDYTAYFDLSLPAEISEPQPRKKMSLRGLSKAPGSGEPTRVEQVRALLHQYGGETGVPRDTPPR